MTKYRQSAKKYLSIGVAVLIIAAIFYFLAPKINIAVAQESFSKSYNQTMVLVVELQDNNVSLKKATKLDRQFKVFEGPSQAYLNDIKYEIYSDQNILLHTGIIDNPSALHYDYLLSEGEEESMAGGVIDKNNAVFMMVKAPYDANASTILFKRYVNYSGGQFLSEQSLGAINLSLLKTQNQIVFNNFGQNTPKYIVNKIVDNGSSGDKLDIVLMGDGYTANQITSGGDLSYYSDVDRFVQIFFDTEPFDKYQNAFNIWRIDVISNESGADHPSDGIYKDTALDATYDSGGIERLLTVNNVKAFGVADLVGDYDEVVVLVKDEQYGGSSGNLAVYSAEWSDTIFGIKFYNLEKAVKSIALHEIGHKIGYLADEYPRPHYPGWWPEEYLKQFFDEQGIDRLRYIGPKDKDYPRLAGELNVTGYKDVELTAFTPYKWTHWLGYHWKEWDDINGVWIDRGLVGCYEGAEYVDYGLFRPINYSKMRDGDFGFGPVNQELIIKRIYEYENYDTNLIQSFSPDPNAGVYKTTNTFTIQKPNIASIGIEWFLDGIKLANKTSWTFDFSGVIVSYGSHTLTARVTDNSDWIRDPNKNQWAQQQIIWQIEKTIPAPIITLTAVALSPTQVNLSWTAYPNASTYQIYRNNSWVWWTAAGTTSVTDSNCSANSTYTYRIDAYDAANKLLAQSNTVSVKTPIPSIVLSATAVSPTQVNLSWTAYPNASTYQIYRNNSWVWWTAANTTSVPDTNCSANSTYTYRIDVLDAANKLLAQSNTVSVKTPPVVVIPPIPTGLASTAGFDNIKWTWNASAGASYYTYKVYDGLSCVTYNKGSNTSNAFYKLTGLPRCETYSFKVKACNSSNQCSGYTGCVSGKTLGCFY